LQSYPATVLNGKNEILGVSKHTQTPLTYFQGVKTPNPQDLCPWPLRSQPVSDQDGLADHYQQLAQPCGLNWPDYLRDSIQRFCTLSWVLLKLF